MSDNFRVFRTELAGRPLVVETGKMAQLANGECLIRYGETVVHVAVTASAKPRDGIDFFPLSVDFEEKLYVGDIHRIERHLYWNDEELQEDDQIINVVVVDGPVTRDGDGRRKGSRDVVLLQGQW